MLFIYSSDGYILAAYNAFYSENSNDDTTSFITLASQKISSAKSFIKSVRKLKKYIIALQKAFYSNGTESVYWGQDGDYITLTIKLKEGWYRTDDGVEATKSEVKDYYSFYANQISYLIENDFELIFIQDDFTTKNKVKYKGKFFAHNDKQL